MRESWTNIDPIYASARVNAFTNSIKEVEVLVEEGNVIQSSQGTDIASQLVIDSLKSRHIYLHNQLAEVMQYRYSEPILISLRGSQYEDHSADLISVANILHIFQRLYSSIAQAITRGPTERGSIGAELEFLTELRLVRSFPSSFGLELRVLTNPDMYGDSISLSSLRTLFATLNSLEDKKHLMDRAGSISQRTVSHCRSLFKQFITHDASPVIAWKDPGANDVHWESTPQRIAAISENLSSIKSEKRGMISVEGFLMGASLLRGRFEFVDQSSLVYTGRIANTVKSQIISLFGQHCSADIEVIDVIDEVSREEKTSFTLIGLK